MKIQCNVCEAAEANVLCCADEAALCWACDEKVHAANKLASKHQRVPLSNSSSQMPKCDICQDSIGYFFCLEDRALLCRKCDVSIHTANTYVSGHQRFLLTGVKVGLEATEPVGSSTKEALNSVKSPTDKVSQSVRGSSILMNGENNEALSRQVVGVVPASKLSFSGGSTSESIPEWPLDDLLGLTDFSNNYAFMEHGSSKADSGKLGDSDFSPTPKGANDYFDLDEYGKVPEVPWIVPEIPSPPTASGLFWPKSFRNSPSDDIVFVPDMCCASPQNFHLSKRQRQF
ncbi:B-box zinc finger protein [Thalictrum thalictroides]|uniref:B-box zinc finger protein n=1 Tax=Thalictrum thalictroides TaxID=46969 RepID=A0A7J6UYQ1_THATH|nr:B-box zinc finger protein [Thalictrum thalictroides]